ncbi:dual specificity protein phosphatase CDC14B isoform X1 [Tachysurus ichikawai]
MRHVFNPRKTRTATRCLGSSNTGVSVAAPHHGKARSSSTGCSPCPGLTSETKEHAPIPYILKKVLKPISLAQNYVCTNQLKSASTHWGNLVEEPRVILQSSAQSCKSVTSQSPSDNEDARKRTRTTLSSNRESSLLLHSRLARSLGNLPVMANDKKYELCAVNSMATDRLSKKSNIKHIIPISSDPSIPNSTESFVHSLSINVKNCVQRKEKAALFAIIALYKTMVFHLF